MQLEALNFAGGGLGKVGDKGDLARVLVGCQPFLHKRLELIFTRLLARLEYDKGLALGQALLVGDTNHGRFQHGGVLHQRGFDFKWRDIKTTDLEHVVTAAAVGTTAIRIAYVFIPTLGPHALKHFTRLFAIAPVQQGSTRPVDVEVTGLAVRHQMVGIITQLDLVTRHWPAGSAVAYLAGPVGEEDVQHLGGADAVDDFNPEVGGKSLAQFAGQGFASG